MLGSAVVVFRETLEAALIVSIVMAACRGLPGRDGWIIGGIAGGLFGACVLAVFAGAITNAASGVGQELVNASILTVAVAMLAWHSIWMSTHGRDLARETGSAGRAVAAGEKPLYAIAIIVGAAVLREGSETVLFLFGMATGDDGHAASLITGGLIGAVGGIGMGALLYAGLLRIPMRHLFTVTNWMILFLMAGLAAQATGFLIQADMIPPLVDPVWDSSALLSEKSLPGRILHALIGYEARPAGMQVLVYLLLLFTVAFLAKAQERQARKHASLSRSLAILLSIAASAAFALAPPPARAEFKVRSPNIDYGEVEIEHNYSTTFDSRASDRGRMSSPTEIGAGVLPFWFVELEGELSKEPGGKWNFDATTFENYFMLTEPGKYWLDFAIFAEYSASAHRADSDTVKIGTLFQKQDMKLVHTLNLFWEKEAGSKAASTADKFEYAWQTRYLLDPLFQPGVEIYGEIEDISQPGTFNQQQFRAGPMFAGSYGLGDLFGAGKVKYEAGYLFGATTATEQGTLRTRLEIEVPF